MTAVARYSTTAAEVPSAFILGIAELGINFPDKAIYSKDASGAVVKVATANASDAELRDRSTHTGSQAISTVTSLQTSLDAKAALNGPTFTGNVTVSKSIPTLLLNTTASGQARRIFSQTNGLFRWEWDFGDGTAESGSDAGSDISISTFNDAGSYKATVLTIYRANGVAFFSAPIKIPSYTVATLPTASGYTQCVAYVSNGASNKRLAVSDGTNWRWPDGAVVS